MVFFRSAKDSFNRFFSLVVKILHSERVADILNLFHVGFPYVPGYYFHMVFAFGTLTEVRTEFAVLTVAFVFPIQ